MQSSEAQSHGGNDDDGPRPATQAAPNDQRATRRFGELIISAGKVAAAIATILAAAFLIWDHFFKSAPAPAKLSPSVSRIQVYPDVTLRNYLNSNPGVLRSFESRFEAKGLTLKDLGPFLATRGVEAICTLGIDGPPGRTVAVSRTLYNARTLARIPQQALQVVPPSHYVSHAQTYQIVDNTWLAYPAGRAMYFVEVDLLDTSGQALATGRSKSFAATDS